MSSYKYAFYYILDTILVCICDVVCICQYCFLLVSSVLLVLLLSLFFLFFDIVMHVLLECHFCLYLCSLVVCISLTSVILHHFLMFHVSLLSHFWPVSWDFQPFLVSSIRPIVLNGFWPSHVILLHFVFHFLANA